MMMMTTTMMKTIFLGNWCSIVLLAYFSHISIIVCSETCFFVVQGNILNDKDPPKQDYKQKILQGITGTGTVIKENINKVSEQIKNWWTGKTKDSSHPKAKKTDL